MAHARRRTGAIGPPKLRLPSTSDKALVSLYFFYLLILSMSRGQFLPAEPEPETVSNQSDFDFCFAERFQVIAGDSTVGNRFMHGGDRHDQRKTPTPELRRVADHDGSPSRPGHRAVDPRFQLIGRGQAVPDVESVYGKKEHVGAQVSQRFLSQWPNQRERVFAQGPAGQNHLIIAARQIRSNVGRVGDNRQSAYVPATTRDGGSGCARIENDHLSGPYHPHSCFGNPQLLVFMKPFFLAERLVLQCTGSKRQRTAVRAFQKSLVMKGFQILSNCNQRGSELFCQIAHENASIVAQKFQNLAAAFLAQHQKSPKAKISFSFL